MSKSITWDITHGTCKEIYFNTMYNFSSAIINYQHNIAQMNIIVIKGENCGAKSSQQPVFVNKVSVEFHNISLWLQR